MVMDTTKPVAWINQNNDIEFDITRVNPSFRHLWKPLYTTPQTKHEVTPLSIEEIKQISDIIFGSERQVDSWLIEFVRAIEAKVRGEK
jgi:hypothetical protein